MVRPEDTQASLLARVHETLGMQNRSICDFFNLQGDFFFCLFWFWVLLHHLACGILVP